MLRLLLFLLSNFSPDAPANQDEIVIVKSRKVAVQQGKQGKVQIDVEVKRGYHIQANKVRDELLIPTALMIDQSDEFTIKEPVFPRSKRFQLEGTDSYLDVYDGRFEILLPFASKKAIKKGNYRLDGKLRYQACDSVRCLFPRSVVFFVDIQVK